MRLQFPWKAHTGTLVRDPRQRERAPRACPCGCTPRGCRGWGSWWCLLKGRLQFAGKAPTPVNKSSVYLQIYPRRLPLPVRKCTRCVLPILELHQRALEVKLFSYPQKKSCEKFKNVPFSHWKHHYPQATAAQHQPACCIHGWGQIACLTLTRYDKCSRRCLSLN